MKIKTGTGSTRGQSERQGAEAKAEHEDHEGDTKITKKGNQPCGHVATVLSREARAVCGFRKKLLGFEAQPNLQAATTGWRRGGRAQKHCLDDESLGYSVMIVLMTCAGLLDT